MSENIEVEIHFTESWTRTRKINVTVEDLTDWHGHGFPFSEDEVIEYLHETECDPEGWTKGQVPPSQGSNDEFNDIEVWHAAGRGILAAPRLRSVVNVVDGL